MADFIPISMGIPWDPWDSSLPHSHAHLYSTFTGALLYADDIVLLAYSCLGLQKLINICMAFGLQWDIRFNFVKSQIACFGSKSPVCDCINIGGKFIKWSDRIKYLDCYFRCGRIEIDSSSNVGKFYGDFNNILNVLGSRRDEMLVMHLVKTYCFPSLLYSCEIWRLNNTAARSIDIAWNNAFRNFLMVTGTRV